MGYYNSSSQYKKKQSQHDKQSTLHTLMQANAIEANDYQALYLI